MTCRHCAFLTLEERGDFVIDDEVAVPALEASGWVVDTVPWRQADRSWSAFDIVVVRSTWDYWDDLDGFLAVLERIDADTRLANPLALLRWNLSKTYLRDLEASAVPIVPTEWRENLRSWHIDHARDRFREQDLVLKPQVGGNGQGVMRLEQAAQSGNLAEALARYHDTPCMLQPFRNAVLDRGEWSLFYFGGQYSHAIRKRPATGEFRSQEERGAHIAAETPTAALRNVAEQALAAIPAPALYARVDLIETDGRGPELVELELIEPSLYFRTDPAAPRRFARALNAWVEATAERTGLGYTGGGSSKTGSR
ncbi:MAG: hypothetical protein V2I57_04530 [Xanthomonadales bacterium]|nr:hypothetical protein [Xanthomonadales bacterium]